MADGNEAWIVDVTEAGFDADVVERSYEVPVLVDFWAPWCGPCRMLGPALEEIARDLDGAFLLAKANTEDHPALGERFGIRGIPAVKLFHRGRVVGEFVGAQPGATVRRWLREHLPNEVDDLVARAEELLGAGDLPGARTSLEEGIAKQPDHGAARLALARLALREGALEEVEAQLDAIDPGADEAAAAATLRASVGLVRECEAAGGEQACRTRLDTDPRDLDARYALGCCLAGQQRWREALDELLAVVQRNNRHREGAARKAMLTIFDLVGRRSDLADEYIRQLQIYA